MENADYKKTIKIRGNEFHVYNINALEAQGIADVQPLPFSIKILVENLLRKLDGRVVKEEDLQLHIVCEVVHVFPELLPGYKELFIILRIHKVILFILAV